MSVDDEYVRMPLILSCPNFYDFVGAPPEVQIILFSFLSVWIGLRLDLGLAWLVVRQEHVFWGEVVI